MQMQVSGFLTPILPPPVHDSICNKSYTLNLMKKVFGFFFFSPKKSHLAAQPDLLHVLCVQENIFLIYIFFSRLAITCLDGATVLETIGKTCCQHIHVIHMLYMWYYFLRLWFWVHNIL